MHSPTAPSLTVENSDEALLPCSQPQTAYLLPHEDVFMHCQSQNPSRKIKQVEVVDLMLFLLIFL